MFEGNTLVHSVRHALTRRSRLGRTKTDVANFIHIVAKLPPMWPHSLGHDVNISNNGRTAISPRECPSYQRYGWKLPVTIKETSGTISTHQHGSMCVLTPSEFDTFQKTTCVCFSFIFTIM